MTIGTLFGIGVGPGDPDLMTLKAVKALATVDILFAAASDDADYSTALSIAAPHVRPGTPTEQLGFPITADRAVIAEAWARHAETVAEVLRGGRSAAFITLGDPMTYSTFGYLMEALQAILPEAKVLVIPGITSFQAAAAAVQQPLAEGGESFAVIPAHTGHDRLKALVSRVENAALLKVYRKFPQVKEALAEAGLLENSVLVSRLGQPGEQIIRDIASLDESPHYFSLILVKK